MSFWEHQKVCHFLNTHTHTHAHTQASIPPPSFLYTSFLPAFRLAACSVAVSVFLPRLHLRRFHFFARVLLELFSFANARAGSKLQVGLEAAHDLLALHKCVFHKWISLQFPSTDGIMREALSNENWMRIKKWLSEMREISITGTWRDLRAFTLFGTQPMK